VSSDRITTYREFWPFYLSEHAKAETRLWHMAGTSVAVAFLIGAMVTWNFWLLLAALIAGYGPAWVTHFRVEKNRPATFRYPVWSLISDFRMTATWLSGRLSRELEKAGIKAP